jgi:alpha-galactosidase
LSTCTDRDVCRCAAITFGPPSETSGEARGFSFVYSGNFLVEAELSEMGRLRCCIGMNPMGLQWHLLPGMVHRAVRVSRMIVSKHTLYRAHTVTLPTLLTLMERVTE